jgi:hypothetical protein
VQAYEDSGVRHIGGGGALIQSQSDIAIAQQDDREPAYLKFVTQETPKAEGHVLLGQRIGQCRTAFVAAVRGIDDGERTMDG